MITVDGRCFCHRCEARSGDIYRMVGTCSNCGARPILMLFRAGDPSTALDCPVCGNWHSVRSVRLASADEIPDADSPLNQSYFNAVALPESEVK